MQHNPGKEEEVLASFLVISAGWSSRFIHIFRGKLGIFLPAYQNNV